MPVSIDSFFHDIANSTSLASVFNNPIYTAILIVLIIMLIIFIMFRSEIDESSEYSFWTLLFRSGFYLLLPILTVLFIHYKNIEREFEQKYDNKALTKTIEAAVEQNVLGNGENLMLSKELLSGAFSPDPVLGKNETLELDEVEVTIPKEPASEPNEKKKQNTAGRVDNKKN